MDYFNMHIYEHIHSIKSAINQLFNENISQNVDHYHTHYPQQSYDPYCIIEEHAAHHQRIRDNYNQRLDDIFNQAMNHNRPYHQNSNTTYHGDINDNNTVSIMPNHVVEELKTLYKSNNNYPDCPICLEPLHEFTMLSCGHKFCNNCLPNINKCACCRKHIQNV